MMGEYRRVTKECTLENMRPELAEAIKAHIERYEIEGVIENILIGCETISTKEKKSLMGSGFNFLGKSSLKKNKKI